MYLELEAFTVSLCLFAAGNKPHMKFLHITWLDQVVKEGDLKPFQPSNKEFKKSLIWNICVSFSIVNSNLFYSIILLNYMDEYLHVEMRHLGTDCHQIWDTRYTNKISSETPGLFLRGTKCQEVEKALHIFFP